jgi:hypothetical protein
MRPSIGARLLIGAERGLVEPERPEDLVARASSSEAIPGRASPRQLMVHI